MANIENLTVTFDVKYSDAICVIRNLLNVLPDNRTHKEDDSWEYAWDTLSNVAQDKVYQGRVAAVSFLKENIVSGKIEKKMRKDKFNEDWRPLIDELKNILTEKLEERILQAFERQGFFNV